MIFTRCICWYISNVLSYKNGNALISIRKFIFFYLLSNMLSNIYNSKEFLSLMSNLAITAFIDGKGILTMHLFIKLNTCTAFLFAQQHDALKGKRLILKLCWLALLRLLNRGPDLPSANMRIMSTWWHNYGLIVTLFTDIFKPAIQYWSLYIHM